MQAGDAYSAPTFEDPRRELASVARALGVSPGRVKQLEEEALKKYKCAHLIQLLVGVNQADPILATLTGKSVDAYQQELQRVRDEVRARRRPRRERAA